LFAHHVQAFRNSSGSLAIFTAILRASSRVSSLAADRRRIFDLSQRFALALAH
jgi:hypothetical protein